MTLGFMLLFLELSNGGFTIWVEEEPLWRTIINCNWLLYYELVRLKLKRMDEILV